MTVRRFIPLAALLLLALTPGVARAGHMCGGKAATIHGTDGPENQLPGFGDMLIGTIGDDVFWAGGGGDVLIGLGGNDIFCTGSGFDVVVGGLGNDTLDYSWLGAPLVGEPGVWVEMTAGLANEGAHPSSDIFAGIEAVNGTDFGDEIFGSPGNDTIRSGGGNDQVEAAAGVDTVDGGAGDDLLFASAQGQPDLFEPGTEIVIGGPGMDTLWGFENGSSQLSCGSENDDLHGGLGNDLLDGGSGSDVADGQAGTNSCPNVETPTNCSP